MSNSLDEVVASAGTAYSEGRYEEALKLYERATISHPNNAVLHANLSAILLRLDRAEEAVEEAQTACRLNPQWAKAHFRLGEALARSQSPRKALVSLCSAVGKQPTNKQMTSSLVKTAAQAIEGFPIENLERLRLSSDAFTLLATVGQMMSSQEEISDAIQILTWALSLDSPSLKIRESALASLGHAHFRSRNYRKAIAYFEQQLELCQELGSSECSVREHIATSAEAAEDWTLSLIHRQRRVASKELSSIDLIAEHCSLGDLYLLLGRSDEALCEFERAQGERATLGKACAKAKMGDTQSALPLLLSLSFEDCSLEWKRVEAIHDCYVEQGRIEEAIRHLNVSLEHATQTHNQQLFTNTCVLLTQCYLRVGNASVASRFAKRLLRMGRSSGDDVITASALSLLASAYEHQKDFSSAIALRKKYLQLVKRDTGDYIRGCLRLVDILETEEQKMEYLNEASESAMRCGNTRLQAISNSAAFRTLLGAGRRVEAEPILVRQRELLECDIDSSSRSLIYEDIGLAGCQEGCSHSSDLLQALEDSLAEAQEANDCRREMELLEKMGDEMISQGKQSMGSAFYTRSLAVAGQLRAAGQMMRCYEKIARLSLDTNDWDACADASRVALSLSRVLSDKLARERILEMTVRAEIGRGDLLMAERINDKIERKKRVVLGADIGRAYYEQGNHEQAKRLLGDFVAAFSSSGYDSDTYQLCSSLLLLSKMETTPANSLVFIEKCIEIARTLENEKMAEILLECFNVCFSMGMIDYCIMCLTNLIINGADLTTDEAVRSVVSDSLVRLPLRRQIGLLLILKQKYPWWREWDSRYCLLLGEEPGDKSDEVNLIKSVRLNDWNSAKRILSHSVHVPLSPLTIREIQEIAARAEFETNGCQSALQNISSSNYDENVMLSLHEISWRDPLWSYQLPLHPQLHSRLRLLSGESLLGDDVTSFEKILSAVLTGDESLEMTSMWYNEMLEEAISSSENQVPSLEVFPCYDVIGRLQTAAAIMALHQTETTNQLLILETCKWIRDTSILRLHGRAPPPRIKLRPLGMHWVYTFVPTDDIILIWTTVEGSTTIYYRIVNSQCAFYSECLLRVIKKMGISEESTSVPVMTSLLITDSADDMMTSSSNQTLMWLREEATGERRNPRVLLLSLSALSPPGSLSAAHRPLLQILQKWADCQIVLLDSAHVPHDDVIMTAPHFPSIIVIRGKVRFSTVHRLLLCGTRSIVIVPETTEDCGVIKLITKISSGRSMSECVASTNYRLIGENDYRLNDHSSLTYLRRMCLDDPSSFILLARAASSSKNSDTVGPLADIGQAIQNLEGRTVENQLQYLLNLPESGINCVADSISSGHEKDEGSWLDIEKLGLEQLFKALYQDCIFTNDSWIGCSVSRTGVKSSPKMATTPRKVKQKAEGSWDKTGDTTGYSSDGEYLVPPRRSKSGSCPRRKLGTMPEKLRSSVTVLSVHTPEY